MNSTSYFRMALGAFTVIAAAQLTGCPIDDAEYDLGFAAGFAEDDEYWMGFDDSMDTVDFGPIYYQGSTIPIVEDPVYDAGYWDGVWYAYNDGYFVAYDYAFTIGFSEGYDLAYYPDWAEFLAGDEHVEYDDGGWSDGYNDGFSEGRVFGAWDWDNDLAFDWLDAMLDYRDGTDLTIGGVSTGDLGPVDLYIYGTDPAEGLKSVRRDRGVASGPVPAIRKSAVAKAETPALSYRPLINTVVQEFSVTPLLSPRSTYELSLETSWLDRVNAYRSALESPAKAVKVGRPSNS